MYEAGEQKHKDLKNLDTSCNGFDNYTAAFESVFPPGQLNFATEH